MWQPQELGDDQRPIVMGNHKSILFERVSNYTMLAEITYLIIQIRYPTWKCPSSISYDKTDAHFAT
jgi:hypothetical protein